MKEKFDIIMSYESVDSLWLWYTHQACLHVRLCSRFRTLPMLQHSLVSGTNHLAQRLTLNKCYRGHGKLLKLLSAYMYGFHYFTGITHISLCVWPQPFSCRILNVQENVHCFSEQSYQLCMMMTLS
jgi:hypothetical protein